MLTQKFEISIYANFLDCNYPTGASEQKEASNKTGVVLSKDFGVYMVYMPTVIGYKNIKGH